MERQKYNQIINKYIKKDYIINAIILAAAFIFIMIMNTHTDYTSDDFKYRFVFDTMGKPTGNTKPISSITDIFISMANHYRLCNGRIVAHGLLQAVLPFGKVTFNIFNSVMYTALGFLIYKHSIWGKKGNPYLLALIFIGMWFFLPAYGMTVLWASGAADYLWCGVIAMAFLLPYRIYAENGRIKNSAKNAVLMGIFGVFAGCTNENTGGGIVLLCVMFVIYYKVKGVKLPVWSFAGATGAVVGAAALILAPGNYRISSKADLAELISRLKDVFSISASLTYVLIIVLCIALILNLIDNSSTLKNRIVLPVIYIITAYAMMAVMTFAALRPERPWFCAVVLLITAVGMVISEINLEQLNKRKTEIAKTTIIVLCTTVFLISFCVEFKNVNNTYQQVREGVELIEEAKAAGKSAVTIPIPVPSDSKYDAYNGTGYVKEKADDWMNEWIAEYYGIEKISGKKK